MNWLRKLYHYLLTNYEARYFAKYYLSIHEIPIYNWHEFYKTMNPKFLSKTGKVCNRYRKVYDMLEAQTIDNFGISEEYEKLLQNKIQIELYYGQQIATGDRSNQIFIDVLEFDNRELSQQKKTELMQTIIGIGKFVGYELNPRTVTVFDFYNYIKFVSDNIKPNGSK